MPSTFKQGAKALTLISKDEASQESATISKKLAWVIPESYIGWEISISYMPTSHAHGDLKQEQLV